MECNPTSYAPFYFFSGLLILIDFNAIFVTNLYRLLILKMKYTYGLSEKNCVL